MTICSWCVLKKYNNSSLNKLFISYFWFTAAKYITKTWFNNRVDAFGDHLRFISTGMWLPFEEILRVSVSVWWLICFRKLYRCWFNCTDEHHLTIYCGQHLDLDHTTQMYTVQYILKSILTLKAPSKIYRNWSWNIFYDHFLPSTEWSRAVVSFWWKNVHNTG